MHQNLRLRLYCLHRPPTYRLKAAHNKVEDLPLIATRTEGTASAMQERLRVHVAHAEKVAEVQRVAVEEREAVLQSCAQLLERAQMQWRQVRGCRNSRHLGKHKF